MMIPWSKQRRRSKSRSYHHQPRGRNTINIGLHVMVLVILIRISNSMIFSPCMPASAESAKAYANKTSHQILAPQNQYNILSNHGFVQEFTNCDKALGLWTNSLQLCQKLKKSTLSTNRPMKSTKLGCLLVLILILLSGDIELNPGPQTKTSKTKPVATKILISKAKDIFPCAACEQPVSWSQRAVCCDNCSMWHHISCIGACTRDYSVLNRSNVSWICCRCNEPSLHSFTFESKDYSTQSYYFPIQNESVTLDSLSPSKLSPQPILTSSPIKFSSQVPPLPSPPTSRKSEDTDSSDTNNDQELFGAPPKRKSWRCLSLNIDGIRSKKDQLAIAIDDLQPDVIAVCETKITEEIKSVEFLPPGYQTDVYRKDRNADGGGVLLAFKDGQNPSQVKFDQKIEAVWVNLPVQKGPPLKICSFYRPPHSGAEPVNQLNELIATVNAKEYANTVIMGDFNCKNIDWSIPAVKKGSKETEAHYELLDLMYEHSLTNTQQNSTRFTNNLDLFITNNTSLIKTQTVIPGISDHEMIVVDLDLKPKINRSPPRPIYLYHKANWEDLRRKTSEFSSIFLQKCENQSTEENWTVFKSHLLSILQNQIPQKQKSKRCRMPWITNEILRMVRRKKRLYKKAKKWENHETWTEYRNFKRIVQKKIKETHSNYLDTKLTEALEDGNPKPFWNYVKSRRKDSSGVAPLEWNGTLETDSNKKAEILSEQFTSVFSRDDGSEIPRTGGDRQPTIEPLTITKNGVEKLLRSVQIGKAHGPDGIPNILLKELASELAPALTFIFGQSLRTGKLPNDWRTANITPIYKKDKHIAANYRPVSLTCVCSKLMEHIIVSHIMKHLEQHKILSDQQHGFRRQRSCLTQLLLTTTDLEENYNKNRQVDVCILDFSKAFDVVCHRKLLAKIEHYGIRGHSLNWIRGFLTDRKQSVVVNGTSSKPAPVRSGVPQGTCLGPVLFLCYINDIAENIESELKLFADDSLLYRPIETAKDQQILQKDLDELQKWAERWDMRFNTKKCSIMNLKRYGPKMSKIYTLNREPLKTVNESPYLGILISDNLNFNAHINNICQRASSTIGFLGRNLKRCPQKLRETAYKTMCRSTLDYASQIWDPYLKNQVNQIEKVQRKAARMVTRNYRKRASVTEMMNTMNWEKLEDRRKNTRLALLYQILNKEIAVPYNEELLKCGLRGRLKHLTHHHEGYKNSFYPRTIRNWNELPSTTRESGSLETFKLKLKA